MSNLFCKTCRFKCCNEDSFTSHLTSKRHIRLTSKPNDSEDENISMNIEEIQEPTPTTQQPPNLNNQVMETLLLQNQMMMKLLMENNGTITKEKRGKPDTMTHLNTKCKNAINFEDLFTREYILNSKYNKYVMEYGNQTYFKIIDRQMLPQSYKFATDFFCCGFNEIEHNKKPIFCSDAKRGTFYVKTKNQWVKMDKFELSKKIYKPLWDRIFGLFMNVARLDKDDFKQIFKREYDNWYVGNKNQIMVNICSIEQDEFVHRIIPALSKLCDIKYASYRNEAPDIYSEANSSNSDSETETDEY